MKEGGSFGVERRGRCVSLSAVMEEPCVVPPGSCQGAALSASRRQNSGLFVPEIK